MVVLRCIIIIEILSKLVVKQLSQLQFLLKVDAHSDLCLFNKNIFKHKELVKNERARDIPIILQLSHSGKGSAEIPWIKTTSQKNWKTIAPSAISRQKNG